MTLGDTTVHIQLDTTSIDSAIAATVRLSEALTRKKIDKKLAPGITTLEKKLGDLFITQGKAIARAVLKLQPYLREAEADKDFDSMFDSASLDSSADMMDILQSAAERWLLIGAADVATDLGIKISFTLANPRALAYTEEYGANLITQIDETTRTDIRRLILAGIDNGFSYDEIAREIRKRYREMAVGKPQQHIRSRAHLIAVTELGNAYSAGNLASVGAMKDNGLKMLKSWLTRGDDKVSEGCKDNEAAGWIDVDDEYPSGDQRPLRFPGCRCVAQYKRAK